MPRPFRFPLAALLTVCGLQSGLLAQDEKPAAPDTGKLFQSLDKDGDGLLTRDEVGEDRARFFERLVRTGDANEDGKLSREEFTKASAPRTDTRPAEPQPGGPDRRNSTGEFLKRLDRDGDGKISKAELPEQLRERLASVFEQAGQDAVPVADFMAAVARGRDGLGNPEQTFDRLDADGDGKLTLAETNERTRPLVLGLLRRAGKGEDGTLTKEEVGRLARTPGGDRPPGAPGMALDRDGDGAISKDELTQAVAQFGEIDRNGDGKLDARELFQAAQRRAPGAGVTDARGTFRELDKDGDGKISKDEAPERVKQNFARVDRDGDGFVSPAELEQAMRRRD